MLNKCILLAVRFKENVNDFNTLGASEHDSRHFLSTNVSIPFDFFPFAHYIVHKSASVLQSLVFTSYSVIRLKKQF